MISSDLIIKKSKLMLIYCKKLLERFTADEIARCSPIIFYKVQQEILFVDVNSIEELEELKNSIEELREVNINDL